MTARDVDESRDDDAVRRMLSSSLTARTWTSSRDQPLTMMSPECAVSRPIRASERERRIDPRREPRLIRGRDATALRASVA